MSISKVKIDNTTHEIIPNGITYCTCSTAEGTAAKVATVVSGNFSLFTGARVVVKFTNKNSASSPTLNVGGTGAKPMRRYGSTAMGADATTSGWIAGAVQAFTYDGTAWVSDYWNNTTYSLSKSDLPTWDMDAGSNTSAMKVTANTTVTLTDSNNNTTSIILSDTDTTYSEATQSYEGLMSASDKTKLDGIATGANAYTLPTASSSTLGGVKIGSNINISSGKISVPTANGTTAGVTIVYPAASCTTFSSDSGTVTPLAVQKGAKMFAITRPSTTTNKAITRYSNTTGDVQDSKIIIEDVTNSRDTSKTAQVIAIPAEGGKKMVYGYCTDQIDGTSFIGGVFDADATSYPYTGGLAIGGTSGNLLWKGVRVATTSDIPSVDTALSSTSTNPVQNKVINTALAGKVSKTGGDTMASPLTVQSSSDPYFNLHSTSTNRWFNTFLYNGTTGYITNRTNDDNYNGIRINPETNDVTSGLQFVRKVDGTASYYNFYGEHNKPTPADIGALPISGGTMTGPITLSNGGLYTNYSIYMKNGVFYNAYDSSGKPCLLLGLSGNALYLGSTSSDGHSGGTYVVSREGGIGLRAGGSAINFAVEGASVTSGSYQRLTWNTYGESLAYLTCTVNGVSNLGSSSNKWKNVYATTGSIQTSDRNAKKNIEDMDDRYIQLFDLVRPVTYQLLKGDRIHTGFISQEVEEAMEKVGLTAEELGFFCKDIQVEIVEDEDGKEYQKQVLDENGDPVYIYSLRYEEYIAIMAEKVKRLEAKYNEKIEKLETKLIELEDKLI